MSDDRSTDVGGGDSRGEQFSTGQADPPAAESVGVKTPEFVPLHDGGPGQAGSLDRFYDVDVTVWAELGRVTMSLGELMRLGPNSVIKLGRSVSAPVELMAQGVRFATGEVVVVDDCFAVRIQEIDGARRGD